MSYQTVSIDANWLTTNGPAPFILAGNTVYTLTTDVDVTNANFTGEVFRLPNHNTQLRINGHYVRLNGKPIRQLTDSEIAVFTSEFTTRIDPSLPISTYNGVVWEGNHPNRITDPGTLGAYRLPQGNDRL